MIRHAFFLLALALLASGQNGAPQCRLIDEGFGPRGSSAVRLTPVVSNLEVPWGIAFLPDGGWLVTERPGRVRLVRAGVLSPEPVAIINVQESGEGGLLGIAVHPDFTKNRFFYVYYSVAAAEGEFNRVERYRLAEDGIRALPDRIILDRIPSGDRHDGGRLRFGPDGMLYISTGDALSPAQAQDPDNLAGKILRVTPEGEAPQDNPFPGSAAYLIGVRNSQGFDWLDPVTLWVTDHGPSGEFGRTGNDELTIAGAGANLGWPEAIGCTAISGRTTPSLVWNEALPPGGAAVFRGGGIPGWDGSILIATLRSKHLQRVWQAPDGTLRNEVYFEGEPPRGFGRLREVVLAPDGSALVTTSNCDGRGSCPEGKDRILRLVPG